MKLEYKNIDINKESKKSNDKGALFKLLNKDISLGSGKLNNQQRYRFYDDLSFLVSSGIDLTTGMGIIIEEEKKEKLSKVFFQVRDSIIKGQSFSESLEQTKQFSQYECISIQIGEESGRLNEVLAEMASYYEMRDQQNQQLKNALSYPVLVILVAFGAVGFMLQVIVPMFAGVYKRFGRELPSITQKVIDISDWVGNNFLLILAFIAVIVIGFTLLNKNKFFRNISDSLLLKLPLIGKMVKILFHARFCHALALLTASQVPLVSSMKMVRDMIKLLPLKQAIENVRQSLFVGENLHVGMQNQKIFDKKLIALTRVAEEVNQIPAMYQKLYKQYSVELKQRTEIIGKLMEPILIIFVGFFVMVILVSMYLPLFQISTTIAQ